MDTRTRTGPLVVIVGETASGKSALALDLAECYQGEIICADAITVRRGLDIGSAKPTIAERQRIPHHLIDIVGTCQEFTAAVFKDRALQVIADISGRQKLPIMVGGTGLYIDAVLYDYGFLPEGDRSKRLGLDQQSADQLLNAALQKGLDVSNIDTRNKRRMIRLLETGGRIATKRDLRPNTLVLGLRVPTDVLRQRISDRVDAMLSAGLEDEVRRLVERSGWECEGLKAIGYREWAEYFHGTKTLAETRLKIISSTMGLAKRQRTWFKRNNSIRWVYNRGGAVEAITTLLNKIAE